MSDDSTTSPYIKNFPFPTFRDSQPYVLKEIEAAFNEGYKYIICELATGFDKSPVAVSVARTLGSSYICTSTKDLQSQYTRDFPFIKVAKGKNNFICTVKEDFIKNGTYKCVLCSKMKLDIKECDHTNAAYGPCVNNENFQNSFDKQYHYLYRGCKYRTLIDDYYVTDRGTTKEQVFLGNLNK
jgi:ATP-dependent DNA helicase DinG